MPDIGQHKRSRTGCLICRAAKVKCSETHPSCQRCSRLCLTCDWPEPGPSLKQIRKGFGPLKHREKITYRQLAPLAQPIPRLLAIHTSGNSKPLPLQDEQTLVANEQREQPETSKDEGSTEIHVRKDSSDQWFLSFEDEERSIINGQLDQGERPRKGNSPPPHAEDTYSYHKRLAARSDSDCSEDQSHSPLPFLHQKFTYSSLLPSYSRNMTPFSPEASGEINNRAVGYYGSVLACSVGTKIAKWSTFGVLFSYANESPTLMHLLLAASLAQMSKTIGVDQFWTSGKWHYQTGSHSLPTLMSGSDIDHCKIMSAMWFIQLTFRTIWGNNGVSSMRRLSRALAEYTIRHRLLDLYPQLGKLTELSDTPKMPSKSLSTKDRSSLSRMIVWLFYEDCEAEFCRAGGYLSGLLCENEPVLQFIYDDSKNCLELFWGSGYPTGESIDDVVRSSALKLRFLSTILFNKVNKASTTNAPAERYLEIAREMDETAMKYSTVFDLAKDNTGCDTQLIGTSKKMVLQWHAVYVYCLTYCLAESDSTTIQEQRRRVIEAMVIILKYIVSAPVVTLSHWFEWPLFLVGLYNGEKSERQWALGQLAKTRYFPVLRKILETQEAMKLEPCIDDIRNMCST